MKRAILMALTLAACETGAPAAGVELARYAADTPPGPTITTVPSGATLTHPRGTCTTPCRVDYPRNVRVTVGKEGYELLVLNIPPAARDVTLEMEPVGRSLPVEEVGLPEL